RAPGRRSVGAVGPVLARRAHRVRRHGRRRGASCDSRTGAAVTITHRAGGYGHAQGERVMGETAADVRHDIEVTRQRMCSTLAELERKLNIADIVRDHPWASLALAVGAGFLLSGSERDVKAAAATVAATKGASSKLGSALDDMVGTLVGGVHRALDDRV